MSKCQDCEFFEQTDQWCEREDKPVSEVETDCPFNAFPVDSESSLLDMVAETAFDDLAKSEAPLREKEIRDAALKVLMTQGKSKEEAEKEMKAWEKSVKRSKSKE